MLEAGVFLLFGLGLGTLLFDLFSGEEHAAEDSPDEETPEGETYTVSSGETITGSAGNDLFQTAADAPERVSSVDIDAGAGDDTIGLFDPASSDAENSSFVDTTLSGGDGNDLVEIGGGSLTIFGGDGDDTVAVHDSDGEVYIYGDAGDDVLSASSPPGASHFSLEGGEGNDTIDMRGFRNGSSFGGEGDDEIYIAGAADYAAAYLPRAYGGEGDDTIHYEGGGIVDAFYDPTDIYGGDGADTFDLTLNEGALTLGGESGFAPTDTSEDGTLRLPAINIRDFDLEEDMIVIDGEALSDAYDLSTARLEAAINQYGQAETHLVLRYESDNEDARDVVVNIGTAAGVTQDAIAFVGGSTPVWAS